MIGRAKTVTAIMIGLMLAFVSANSSFACRGYRGWPDGHDLGKLRTGQIVIRAKLIEAVRLPDSIEPIMGRAYDMHYLVEITDVAGVADGVQIGTVIQRGKRLATILKASVCESYFPADYAAGEERLLVLWRWENEFLIVGGEEKKNR